jgi:hypothetical protein
MVSLFEPLLKKKEEGEEVVEAFVNENDTRNIVANVFVGVSLMLMAMFLTWLFIWAYRRDVALFILVFTIVMFFFAVEMVIFVSIVRGSISKVMFTMFMGSVVFAAFMCIVLVIFFAIKVSHNASSGRPGYQASYAPQNVQEYLNS